MTATTPSPTCEPPAGTAKNTVHNIGHHNPRWNDTWMWSGDRWFTPGYAAVFTPEQAAAQGYRYVGPDDTATPPAAAGGDRG